MHRQPKTKRVPKPEGERVYCKQIAANAKYTWQFLSADGTRFIPVYSQRPIADVATDTIRDAIITLRSCPTTHTHRHAA